MTAFWHSPSWSVGMLLLELGLIRAQVARTLAAAEETREAMRQVVGALVALLEIVQAQRQTQGPPQGQSGAPTPPPPGSPRASPRRRPRPGRRRGKALDRARARMRAWVACLKVWAEGAESLRKIWQALMPLGIMLYRIGRTPPWGLLAVLGRWLGLF